MASSGGVGAVRRACRSRRVRGLALIGVIGFFAGGAGNSVPGVSATPFAEQLLSGLRLDRGSDPPAHDALAADQVAAPGGDAAAASLEALPAASVETSPASPPTSAQPYERPIVAPPSFPRTRATAPRASRAAYSPGPKDGGVWAVVVGIDDYPGADADLRAAVADARDVDSALAAYGVPASHRLVLLDGQATADNIRGALAWLVGRASPDSTVVFFYSGHVRQVAGDPDRDGEAVDEAIVAADGDNVYDGQVANLLQGLEARSTWLGIAACFGAGFEDALAPGRILTAAAGENDVAYENSTLGHSYMVEYMVRRAMLQGKAPASVQESFAWARAQIARDYPNRQPAMIDRSRGPIVLGRAAAAAPERSTKPAPQPPPDRQEPQQPEPTAPPPPAPEQPKPGGPACAQVLGVSVCSEQKE